MLPPKRTINLFFKNEPSQFYLRHTYRTPQNITFVKKFVSIYNNKIKNVRTDMYIQDLKINKEKHLLFFVREKDLILYVEESEYDMLACSSYIVNRKGHSIVSFTKGDSFFDGKESL